MRLSRGYECGERLSVASPHSSAPAEKTQAVSILLIANVYTGKFQPSCKEKREKRKTPSMNQYINVTQWDAV